MATDRTSEVSFELPAEEVAVLDGYCNAKGIKRKAVLRRLLKEWSDEQHRISIVICRVAGDKPISPGNDRDGSASSEFGELS